MNPFLRFALFLLGLTAAGAGVFFGLTGAGWTLGEALATLALQLLGACVAMAALIPD